MSHKQPNIIRSLDENKDIEQFVENVLQIHDEEEAKKAIRLILNAEIMRGVRQKAPTNKYKTFRTKAYRGDKEREQLRKEIVMELKNLTRLENDEDIKLGKGGAKPRSDVQNNRLIYYIIGLPASGKSGIASRIADLVGAYIVDSDLAKRKFVESGEQPDGSSLVHEESDEIVFSREPILGEDSLFMYCIKNGINMVIPKIGSSIDGIDDICKVLQNNGYSVYLISVDLSREKATQRAYQRYKKTGRYVPLGLIFDQYANEPILCYFRIVQREQKKKKKDRLFSGFAQYSTDTLKDGEVILIEERNMQDIVSRMRKE